MRRRGNKFPLFTLLFSSLRRGALLPDQGYSVCNYTSDASGLIYVLCVCKWLLQLPLAISESAEYIINELLLHWAAAAAAGGDS